MDYKAIERIVKSTKDIILDKSLLSDVKNKAPQDYVTAIDLGVSNYLKKMLNAIDSEIGFLSEEEEGQLTDYCWILDPIDGTTNLIRNYNMSAVSLGLYKNGEIIYGIVYNPFTDECFTAEKGKGAYLNGNKISVSVRKYQDAIIEFGAGNTHRENMDENWRIAKDLFKYCMDIRRTCCASLALCYIAAGRIEGYFEKVLKSWDIAAGSLILTEAGGKLTTYENMKVGFKGNTTLVAASNNLIHYNIISII